MAKRRPIFSVLALLLAVGLLAGTSVPAPWLWQCRHASQLVAAIPVASPNAMPCHMTGQPMTMAAMSCCANQLGLPTPPAGGRPAVAAVPCRPKFVPAFTLPVARLGADGPQFRLSASSTASALPPFAPDFWQTPSPVVDQPRPPPGNTPPPSERFRTPSLRAPPAA